MSSDSRKILSSGTSWSCAQKTQMENPHQPSHLQPLGPTHQQHAHSHHGRSARGHGAVHQDHVVVTNVLGQPQVVELGAATGSGLALTHGTSGSRPCALRRPPRTSGSPVSWLVWMRMVPMRTSLHTARSAGSMVSPARRMDTPVIWGGAVWAVRTRPAGPPRPGPAPAPAPPPRVPASLRSTCPRSPAPAGSAPRSPERSGGAGELRSHCASGPRPAPPPRAPGRAGTTEHAR